MEPELKAYLDKITSQLADMKGDLVGTRDEMSSMEIRLREHIETVEIRLREHIETVEIRTREHTETIETKLLTEFWKWAQTAEMRYSQDHAAVAGIDGRVKAIEDRVSELERRRRAV